MFSVDEVPQAEFNFRDDGGAEWRPKSFLAIWGPAPPSRPRRLCISGGTAPRRRPGLLAQQFQNGDITGKIIISPISICQNLAFPSNFPVQDHLLKSAISPGNFGENVSSLTLLGR